MPAIETHNLSKHFGSFIAVDAVDFILEEGDICALVGPNGAGKTTFIKLLVGLLHPTGGSISLFGINPFVSPVAAKSTFGYVSDDPTAYEFLTGREFLTLTGRLRGLE